ncbi:transcription factor MYB3-like [Vitis vinifera]|nr:transcription factor MYB3-like [Vitis vinifera]|eukprot:XP_010662174.1 PREDICTED: transcription factor MYB3-like [Vitis vinifera]
MARPERPRWTEVEDWVLFECKTKNMDLPWPDIAKLTELDRSGKNCRERWKYHLDPDVKMENFSQEEDDSIVCFQSLYGNSWSSIAAHLPGRTDNDVKNRWYNHLKKQQLGRSTGDQQHIDPNASPSSIPTLVSASQEIASTWSISGLASLEGEFTPTEEVFKFWSA